MSTSPTLEVPDALVASFRQHSGAPGLAWLAALPALAAEMLDHWALRTDPR